MDSNQDNRENQFKSNKIDQLYFESADGKDLNDRLDEVDHQLLELFEEHMAVTEAISRQRIAGGGKLFDSGDEHKRIERLAGETRNDFNRKGAQELFTQLFAMSRKQQYHLLTECGAAGRLPFFMVDELDKKRVRVVYQGVPGAYSHAAMAEYFGKDVNCFHVDTWRDAMEAIADGEADYAVLPIENSSVGIVADNFDLLVDFENYIVAEQVIKVEHVLMGLSDAQMGDIRTVYSHPQALAQCAPFLDQHPQWKRERWSNTAAAALKVSRDKDKSQAAIGSEFAARLFGLKVLERHIYANEGNSTRFLIVTNQKIFRRDASRISICFEVPHRSGTLYNILSHFIYNDLNMTRIESRPIRGKNWEYRFFIDFDGNLNSSAVKNALRGIRSEAINMKILGNY